MAAASVHAMCATRHGRRGGGAGQLVRRRQRDHRHHQFVVAADHRAREPVLPALLRALRRAEQVVADDPVRAQQILGTHLSIRADEAGRLMAEHDHRLRLEQSLMNTLRGQGRWIQREGLGTAPDAPDALGRTLNAVELALLRGLAPAAMSITR